MTRSITRFSVCGGTKVARRSRGQSATLSRRLLFESLEHRALLAADVGFAVPRAFAVGDDPLAVATSDVNGDGKLDLVTANYSDQSVSVLHGNGQGGFGQASHYPTLGESLDVSIADVNGDDRPDIITANLDGSVSVLLQQSRDGSFQLNDIHSTGLFAYSVATGDVNDDGHVDLVASFVGLPGVPGGISLLLGDGSGNFQAERQIATDLRPVAVAVADLNGDGHQDIVAANGFNLVGDESNDVAVVMGLGQGDFADSIRYLAGDKPADIAIADVNADGILDLVSVGAESDDVSVLLGADGGTFAPAVHYAVGPGPASLTLADLNGDTYVDIAVGNRDGHDISIVLNREGQDFVPQGRFTTGNGILSFPIGGELIVAGNLDEDPLPDLAVVSQDSDELFVLINTPVDPTEPIILNGPGARYLQDFDVALGTNSLAGLPLPPGWSATVDGRAGTSTTQNFPTDTLVDGIVNVGQGSAADRTLAVASTDAAKRHELQFAANVTGGDVNSLRLAFDIEAWRADGKLVTPPGEAAFHLTLEVDSGQGFQTVHDFGTVTTGRVLPAPIPATGMELWKTDGTNVSLVGDILPGPQGSEPSSFAVFNKELYFVAGDTSTGDRRIYKTNGSDIVEVAQIPCAEERVNRGFCSNQIWSYVLSDSLVYNILSYSPDMLARIDSSGAATIIPNPNQYQNFRGGVVYKDELYLVVEENEPDVGRELWRFSGQTLELAADINTRHVPFNYPESSSSPDDFVEYRGDLYFTAGPTLENDRELWKFDGATATQVAEIMPRQALGGSTWCGSCVDILGVLDDKLVFTATDDFESASIPSNVNKRWLWTYDGSQIEKVEGIEFSLGRGAGAFTVVHPTEFNGALYFVALADNAGKELWKWDGHSPPTRLTDIQPRAYHSLRSHLIVFKDHLYFPAQEVGGFGREARFGLWRTDGDSVSLVANPNPHGSFIATTEHGFLAPEILVSDDNLYFLADDGETGTELWRTDGTNVVRVTDINPGPGDSSSGSAFALSRGINTTNAIDFNGEVYFAATNGDGQSNFFDGNAPANRLEFDSGPISAQIPDGSTLRLRFRTPDGGAHAGYVYGLDNFELEFLNEMPLGDANRDGIFNSSDLVLVLAAGEYEDGIAGNSTWEEGDWDGDGDFTSNDLVVALQTGSYVPAATRILQSLFAAPDDENDEMDTFGRKRRDLNSVDIALATSLFDDIDDRLAIRT